MDKREKSLEDEQVEIQKLKDSELDNLERIARLSQEEAKKELLERLDETLIAEKAERIKETRRRD